MYVLLEKLEIQCQRNFGVHIPDRLKNLLSHLFTSYSGITVLVTSVLPNFNFFLTYY